MKLSFTDTGLDAAPDKTALSDCAPLNQTYQKPLNPVAADGLAFDQLPLLVNHSVKTATLCLQQIRNCASRPDIHHGHDTLPRHSLFVLRVNGKMFYKAIFPSG